MFLLFTLIPTVELYLLLQIGALVGPLSTVILILVTGMVGAWLAKREGISVLRTLQQELRRGLPPGSRLMEAALVVAGGLLLITPGVLTDITGFSLILPWTRRPLAKRVGVWLKERFDLEAVGLGSGPDGSPGIHVDLGGPGRSRTEQRDADSGDDPSSPFDHPVR